MYGRLFAETIADHQKGSQGDVMLMMSWCRPVWQDVV